MQFGFNDMGAPTDSLETTLELLAQAGYDGFEPSLSPSGELDDPAEIEQIADLTDRYDLAVPSVLTEGLWSHPLSSPDDETRERGVDIAIQTIEGGATLGAETMLIVPGIVTEDVPYDIAYDCALESMAELAPVAHEHGLTLAIENVWNDFLLSPLEFASFIDEAAEHGPVKAYFDVGNVLRFGDPAQWIRILDDRIEMVHIKDYDMEIDTIDGFTYPGQGDVPWEDVVAALDDVGYDGWISPEVPPYQTCPELMPGQVLKMAQAVFADRSNVSGLDI
ncbi:sugar phosphate isomerase/epimerase [Saliphagus sp. LR7]|uniref:sugar phosphate isomerase/epimerase family protein n=1 Tax=Saliphagus sp. LR7 TaxID=2282654 RepID=UPI000DF7895A|nr:sugar phosphate isomerase/epimerase family protein [Saliphagus sp. LR7]